MIDEETFSREAICFLSRHAGTRAPEVVRWGEGPEGLAIFHETTGDEEQLEVADAKRWQATRWRAGFGWICGPTKYGGRGLPASFDRLYRRLEANYAVADLSPLRIGLSTVGPSLVANGTEAQVRRFAVGIQAGEVVACQLFSEPEAGSDLANVKTRAVRDGDVWILSGQKVWTSNAQFADIGLALARTDPNVPKHRGLTAFVVPMRSPGVDVRPIRQLTGGASFNEVFLDGVEVPDHLRVGTAGDGWRVAVSTLSAERAATGDRSHAMTARALRLLIAIARRNGKGNDPLVRQSLAEIHARLEVARFHQLRVQSSPEGVADGPQRAADKLLLAGNLQAIGEAAARILGPRVAADVGEWGTFAWSSWILGATGYRLGGGTDEVLKTMVAEKVLGLPRAS
ncbi:MAG TPA: acyl-CoA dehydrogenase family protein [Acidimicrobiales bacterium]|nr:acyl-CoA dehydrogenase family protein [Acidimicrobiales bacterium]